MSIRIPIALVLAVIAASPAFAQPGQESAAAVARIDTERRCIEAQRDRLAGALLRLGNTRQAISSGAPGSPAVAAAIRTASELEIEIRTIGNDIARCANPAAEQPPTVATSGQSTTTSGTQPPAVLPVATNVQRTQEGISSQRPVVEQGTPIVRDRVLSANLKLVLGERLDGSGYHRGIADRDLASGLLGAADAYQAMLEDRPYRPSLGRDAAAAELRAEAGRGRVSLVAVDAVLAAVGETGPPARRPHPAGLTDREVEILRLIARGRANKQVASALGISPKTVGRHVEHIYAKAGVRTRAGATLFAMEHGLLTGVG